MRLAFAAVVLTITAGPGLAAGPASVIATTFADPADVATYRACLHRGGSAKACLAEGDNAIGLWGHRTDAPTPMCALRPGTGKESGARGRRRAGGSSW